MKKFTFQLLVGPLVLLLLGCGRGAADPILWTYGVTGLGPGQVFGDNVGGSGMDFFDPQPTSKLGSADTSVQRLVLFNTPSGGIDGTEQKGVFSNAPYSFNLFLKDGSSGKVGFLTFTGSLNGPFGPLQESVTNQFTGATTQSVTLAKTTFTVTLKDFKAPGGPDDTGFGSPGSIDAYVDVRQSPEPSALALACLGGIALGAAAWRYRRHRAAQATA